MQSIYDADFDYPSHFDVSWKALFAKLLFLENIMFVLEGQAHSVFGKQMKAAILYVLRLLYPLVAHQQ